ncbi:hypothetical protein TWF730_004042 [Orbilia blumenaviensis]|uniref:Uncharacterized protein n=1 Tax=Orbilia blumenaviensis TaxID=1796055 RepID=A0AAV9U1W3_9PEZI
MHFKSASIPAFYIALSALYHGTTAISAASSVLDFRNLVIPSTAAAPVPLGDFGGIKFQNIEVARMATQPLGTDGNEGVMADANGLLHPTADKPSTTIAIIDPKSAPSGGEITLPADKRLQSFSFFCCSSKEGESILDGHECTQVECKATAQISGMGKDGKTVTQIGGTAVASASKAADDISPGPFVSSLELQDATADFATGTAQTATITFASVDSQTEGGATSRMRRGRRATAMKGAEDIIIVIPDMVILPEGQETQA